MLTQYLGVPEDEFVIEPFIGEKERVLEGDIFLICSDGVTDGISDQGIQKILEEKKGESAADSFIEEAKEKGSHDNISVIMIEVQG